MTIDAQCKSCQKRYRVNESLAGRTAECKHCGAKFRIPYRSAVVRLEDVEEAEAAPAATAKAAPAKASAAPQAANVRTFEEYAPLVPKPKKSKLDEPTENNVSPVPLPAIVTDLWLPIGVMILCYGVALLLSVNAVLRSYGVGAGFIMIGLVVASLFIAIIPLTMKAIDSASGTFDFKLSNSLWTQSAAIVSVPMLGGTIGLIAIGGITAALIGTAIGVLVAIPLTMLLLQVSIGSGLQTGVLASLFFLLSTGGTVVVIWIIASVLFPIWYLNLPWGDAPASNDNTTVAANVKLKAVTPDEPAEQAATTAPAEAIAAATVEPKSVEKPAAPNIFDPSAPSPAPAAVAGAVIPPAEVAQETPAVTIATTVAPGGRPVDELLPPAPAPIPSEPLAKAPTTAPAATPALAAQKQWVVTIVSISRPDTSAINAELADVGRMVGPARSEASQLREHARRMEADFDMVPDGNNRGVDGVRYEKKHRHSKGERGKAAAAALRAEGEAKRMQNRIAQLERERAELERSLIIAGQLHDGTLVEIEAGPRDARFAEALVPGSRWNVEGGAKIAVGVLQVKPRTIQPLKILEAAAPPPPP